MRDILVLLLHVVVMVFRLRRPGGLRSVIAESVLVQHQLLILNRVRKRAPNLRVSDRIDVSLSEILMIFPRFGRRMEAVLSTLPRETAKLRIFIKSLPAELQTKNCCFIAAMFG